ncbi:MAG: hypothetical protein R2865_02090 [Deinococcales bacterium]
MGNEQEQEERGHKEEQKVLEGHRPGIVQRMDKPALSLGDGAHKLFEHHKQKKEEES